MIVYIKSKITEDTKKADISNSWKRNAFPMAEQGAYLRLVGSEFITGYNLEIEDDEDKIFKDTKHAKHALVVEKRKIEKGLNVSLDPSKDNEFLEDLRIILCGRNNEEMRLNLNDPLDRLKYKAATAGAIVAPSLKALNEAKYIGCMYYFTDPKKEESTWKELAKVKNKIAAKLAVFEDNRHWLLSISFKLGLPARAELSLDHLYSQVSDYKDKISENSEAKKILAIVESDPQDLYFDFILESALLTGLIKTDSDKNKVFKHTALGKTKEEVRESLKKASLEDVYAELVKAVTEKYNID